MAGGLRPSLGLRATFASAFANSVGSSGPLGGLGPKGWVEEDRRNDWYCPMCRERNFMKRNACFKCNEPKPEEGKGLPPPKPPPQAGQTLNGMVKSYNKKGFGFIMCLGANECQDIYYTRENVSPRLLHPDMPGEHVSFELFRGPDGRLTAKNIRPVGEEFHPDAKGHIFGKQAPLRPDEDRSLDWVCLSCNERNFTKRIECFRCRTPRDRTGGTRPKAAPPPRKTFSPHAGARAIRESLQATGKLRSRSRKKSSSSSSSSKSKKEKKAKKKKKKKHKKRKSSSSGSSGSKISCSSGSGCEMTSAGSGPPEVRPGDNPEIDAAKAAALEQMMNISKLDNKDEKMSEWRALLRQWHPDKNPDRVELATAVFQFLQKGKPIIDS